jgi:hypothetical protein
VGPEPSGQVRNNSPPPGFDPRTVQSLASRNTDRATRPTEILYTLVKLSTVVVSDGVHILFGFKVEFEGCTLLRNDSKYSPADAMLHPIRLASSSVRLNLASCQCYTMIFIWYYGNYISEI